MIQAEAYAAVNMTRTSISSGPQDGLHSLDPCLQLAARISLPVAWKRCCKVKRQQKKMVAGD